MARDVSSSVLGSVKTLNGERVIDAQAVSTWSQATKPITPLGVNNLRLSRLNRDAPIIPQIAGTLGTYNVGLLMKTWGRVQPGGGSDWFYIDDGSLLTDGFGNTGVKVTLVGILAPPKAPPQEGHYVLVTGLSSCEIPLGQTQPVRLIRPRCADDIIDLGQF
ncbi:MAG: hypothetical protein NT018_00895 [Armatimonadetes bacterium]|nr:hypothetical protein [Armatimonadota bacterium]